MPRIIAGILGGIVVGFLGGSDISVSGPAAGLTVIVVDGIGLFDGNFHFFLVALVLAGGLQMLMGVVHAGTIVDYVPTSVIRGMLSAIGIVIILKQIPHALGYDRDPEGDMAFVQAADGHNTLETILIALQTATSTAVLISVISVVVLLAYEHRRIKKAVWSTFVPGPLVVVVLGIVINELMAVAAPGRELSSLDKHLVQLPVAGLLHEIGGLFLMPDFSVLNTQLRDVIGLAITLALVASLETLLSLEAADKLDPQKRISRKNKELRAQGAANLISGLIGGLPITAVIVRTSANVYAGALTKRSAIVHGLLLAACALFIPTLLNKIPLASLAVILIFVGYKLASIKVFKHQYGQGLTQFLPFLITLLAIIFTDLLIGVLVGIVVGFFIVLRTLHSNAITLVSEGNTYLMRINKDLTFLHKNDLKAKLLELPNNASVLIDGNRAASIDTDIYEEIIDFLQQAHFRGIHVELRHLHRQAPKHILPELPPEGKPYQYGEDVTVR